MSNGEHKHHWVDGECMGVSENGKLTGCGAYAPTLLAQAERSLDANRKITQVVEENAEKKATEFRYLLKEILAFNNCPFCRCNAAPWDGRTCCSFAERIAAMEGSL